MFLEIQNINLYMKTKILYHLTFLSDTSQLRGERGEEGEKIDVLGSVER